MPLKRARRPARREESDDDDTTAFEKEMSNVNLYELIGVEKGASEDQIRKAYYKVSLACHPDKVATASDAEKEAASQKFQRLSFAYKLLTNERERAQYDKTGKVGSVLGYTTEDWGEVWRRAFPGPSAEFISDFEKNYVGSEKEKADVLAAYIENRGDMNIICESIPFCETDDAEQRISDIIVDAIAAKEVPALKKFVCETDAAKAARSKKRKREAARFKKETAKEEEGEVGGDGAPVGAKAKGKGKGKGKGKDDSGSDEDELPAAKRSAGDGAGEAVGVVGGGVDDMRFTPEMLQQLGLGGAGAEGMGLKDAAAAMAQQLFGDIKRKAERKQKKGRKGGVRAGAAAGAGGDSGDSDADSDVDEIGSDGSSGMVRVGWRGVRACVSEERVRGVIGRLSVGVGVVWVWLSL